MGLWVPYSLLLVLLTWHTHVRGVPLLKFLYLNHLGQILFLTVTLANQNIKADET